MEMMFCPEVTLVSVGDRVFGDVEYGIVATGAGVVGVQHNKG